MKKKSMIVLTSAFVLLSAFSCGGGGKATGTNEQSEKVVVNVPQFDADSAYLYVKNQVDFGPRVPNTKEHVACGNYLAGKLEADISARGRLPILVGGTGLYVQSFLYGVRFAAEKTPDGLREQLAAEMAEKGPEAMYKELQTADPEAAAAIHPNNQVRVLRALEHFRATGKRLSEQKAQSLPPERPYRSLVLGLDFPDRAQLYRRIDLRVDRMLDAGLLDEAKLVYDHRQTYRTAAQAIGYKEFFPYFEGTATLDACTEKLKQASRNYAKRQLTWFRHMDGVVWLDASAPDVTARAVQLTREFLAKG